MSGGGGEWVFMIRSTLNRLVLYMHILLFTNHFTFLGLLNRDQEQVQKQLCSGNAKPWFKNKIPYQFSSQLNPHKCFCKTMTLMKIFMGFLLWKKKKFVGSTFRWQYPDQRKVLAFKHSIGIFHSLKLNLCAHRFFTNTVKF